jgi:hypothetical protein
MCAAEETALAVAGNTAWMRGRTGPQRASSSELDEVEEVLERADALDAERVSEHAAALGLGR